MGYYLLSYLCLLVFVLATGWRVVRQARMPLHLRWELYPVQHETGGREAYGGSYLEAPNWWEKPEARSGWNALTYMLPEILLLRGLWRHNRTLWRVSFPFHFGLYLMIATIGLLALNALLDLAAPAVFSDGGVFRRFLGGLIVATGWSGTILGGIGCAGLLCRRLTDPALRASASLVDYFNLGFILLFFLSAAAGLAGDPALTGARTYATGLLTGGAAPEGYSPGRSAAGAATAVLGSLLVAYIPLTHMIHMVMKYFFYHHVKWDDAPNRRGGRIEAAARRNLDLKPTWQAGHVGGDGQRSWREIVSEGPEGTA